MIIKFPTAMQFFNPAVFTAGSNPAHPRPMSASTTLYKTQPLGPNNGHRYLYADSSTGAAGHMGGFQLSPHDIDDSAHSPLRLTLDPAYREARARSEALQVGNAAILADDPSIGFNMVVYNDQPPGANNANEIYAHAKGVYVERQGAPPAGFWLVHSVPNFKDPVQAQAGGSPYPRGPPYSNGFQQGQSFACIALTTPNAHAHVKQALLRNRVYVSLFLACSLLDSQEAHGHSDCIRVLCPVCRRRTSGLLLTPYAASVTTLVISFGN